MPDDVDTSSILPNEYAAAIGRIAETWAQFEHQIDIGIWSLSGTHQQLAACMTSQMANYFPKMKALIARAEVRGASPETIRKLNQFSGKLQNQQLAHKRNRAVHDPRLLHRATGNIRRLEITTKPRNFKFLDKDTRSLENIRNKIFKTVSEFISLRDALIDELEALPEESLPLLPEIVPHRGPRLDQSIDTQGHPPRNQSSPK